MYFQHCKTENEVRKAYRTLAKKLHPDLGGDEEKMKILITEYKESCKQKSIAEIKKSRKNCATEKGHDKTSWRKSFASRDKASI